ncbi:PadR family transcriptional regulator [Cellulomonas sp. URHE0023]|uniref:PadR family transcriptional regulator n=1 Tax=Cellulomonas sp. URHE0023 TaxID=1380354 RepID=UPI001E580F44|nr:PadR family transcriptional regulator [Cellulomonas sp. URHE0023]
MSEQAYLVLLALAQEPRHGYGIVQAVKEISDDRVRLGAGTLYGILDRLVQAQYAEASGEIVVDGRLRRYYRLTSAGQAVLREETARIAGLAARAQRLLGPVGRPALGGA